MTEKEFNVAACGLYCGTCRRFLNGKCPGCANNDKATWCSVRNCCKEHGWMSCAECNLMPIERCPKFNAFISKVFGFVFRSERGACIRRIREIGVENFAKEMTESGNYNRPVKKH